MYSEIYWVDIYQACILVRTLDPKVVGIKGQGACVGLCWLLLDVLGSGRTWSKLRLWFRLFHLLLLRGWLRNKRLLFFLFSFLFLFNNLLRSTCSLQHLLLGRDYGSLLSSLRLLCWLRIKWIKSPPSRGFLFDLFDHRSLIFPRGTNLIELIVLSVIILFVSFSLIAHT